MTLNIRTSAPAPSPLGGEGLGEGSTHRRLTQLAPANDAANDARNDAAPTPSGPAAPFASFPPVEPGGNDDAGRARKRVGGPPNGTPNDAPNDARFANAKALEMRLEEAGETLLLLPQRGYTTRLRTSTWNVLDEATEAYATQNVREGMGRLHLPVPSAAKITRMDEALSWLPLIPDDKYVLRRLVASRMLVSPLTGRHLFPWRRLATLLGADHKAIQRWHGQGIDLLLSAVNRRR
jgi:hypothetical protein